MELSLTSLKMQANTKRTLAATSEAEERVKADLVNALLAEQLFAEWGRGELLSPAEWNESVCSHSFLSAAALRSVPNTSSSESMLFYRWWMDEEVEHYLFFAVQPAIIQPYRYSGGGIYEVKSNPGGAMRSLDAIDLMERMIAVIQGTDTGDYPAAYSRMLDMLRITVQQTVWSLEAPQQQDSALALPAASCLLELERRASYRDRPFHPVAKAKLGWTQEDCQAYSVEFGQPMMLHWMAVKRQFLLQSRGYSTEAQVLGVGKDTPADMLLSADDRERVAASMARRGLTDEAYVAIPVHPWQMDHVLPQELRVELEEGVCVPLDVTAGAYISTSSARSLAPKEGGNQHVKLPLGIVSLGAVRYLPAVHMINGLRGSQLLEQAKQRDAVLGQRLYLCDESSWWAYMPDDESWFADHPRHLSALIREYPSALTSDPAIRLIPMSSLAVLTANERGHVFDEWMQMRKLEATETSIVQLFREVCSSFFQITLRLFRLGLLPEIHGQNTLLVWKEGHIEGILLRDHDTVRLHLPWLEACGLNDPCYMMKPGYPNSLYNETPEKLLLYLQTLGIQVNLYAILETVSHYYQLEESRLWVVMQESLESEIVHAQLPDTAIQLLRDTLFEKETWPWKQLIRPLLAQQEPLSGSMPAGIGEVPNPFLSMPNRTITRYEV